MGLKVRLTALLVGLVALLGIGASAANAQVQVNGHQVKAAASCENYYYISGNGVRIRKQPNGAVAGYANYWERVTPMWRSGVWVYVLFQNRPLYVSPRSGYVHQDYVSYRQPTCW